MTTPPAPPGWYPDARIPGRRAIGREALGASSGALCRNHRRVGPGPGPTCSSSTTKSQGADLAGPTFPFARDRWERRSGPVSSPLSGKGDLALAVAVVVVLQLVNILAVPFWAGEVVSGASLSGGQIVGNLVALVLGPLAIGLAIRARYAAHAERWKEDLVKVANLALVIALVAGISVNWDTIVSLLGDWVLLASVLIVAVSLLAGRLIGGRDSKVATTTMLVSGFRFGSLGLIIIGTQLDGRAEYLGPAIVFTLAGFVLPLLLSVELGRRPIELAQS